MTNDELRAIDERAKAATKGPWAWYSFGEKCYAFAVVCACDRDGNLVSGRIDPNRLPDEDSGETPDDIPAVVDFVCESEEQSGSLDCAFIAHARADVPELVAEVRRLRAFIEKVASINPAQVRGHSTAWAMRQEAKATLGTLEIP